LAEFDVVRVIDFILSRVEKGREEHGDLDIASDRRDFKNEEQQEHADLVVYRAIDEIKRLDAERAALRADAASELLRVEALRRAEAVAREPAEERR
jgi:hypothetical protein